METISDHQPGKCIYKGARLLPQMNSVGESKEQPELLVLVSENYFRNGTSQLSVQPCSTVKTISLQQIRWSFLAVFVSEGHQAWALLNSKARELEEIWADMETINGVACEVSWNQCIKILQIHFSQKNALYPTIVNGCKWWISGNGNHDEFRWIPCFLCHAHMDKHETCSILWASNSRVFGGPEVWPATTGNGSDIWRMNMLRLCSLYLMFICRYMIYL